MYIYKILPKFAEEFSGFPGADKEKVLDFLEIYEKHGFSDFSKYEGKIAPSWVGLDVGHPDFIYCQANCLWHYHVGIPKYIEKHEKYKTSEWVLHFQMIGPTHINIVDVYAHYDSSGNFYIPSGEYLDQKPVTP